MRPKNIWSDSDGPKHEARWVGTPGKYLARGDRGIAWRGAVGSSASWRFQPDGSADVWLCERHHFVLVDELLYGKAPGRGDWALLTTSVPVIQSCGGPWAVSGRRSMRYERFAFCVRVYNVDHQIQR